MDSHMADEQVVPMKYPEVSVHGKREPDSKQGQQHLERGVCEALTCFHPPQPPGRWHSFLVHHGTGLQTFLVHMQLYVEATQHQGWQLLLDYQWEPWQN
ncbi:hypothetical protein Taro_036547 [Colocasia esculenta]|uniref:Uncharacterized protein n=1 Tax=Colocasia esculenta TaxID=4460 RepID=A0A843W1V8_COLES|nr:hypothetical protein [Colocasia esculenta]